MICSLIFECPFLFVFFVQRLLHTNILDVNPKTAKRRFVDAKSKRKSMTVCNCLGTKETKSKGHRHVSVRELYNSLVSDPNDGGLKDARNEDGKIIISDSTLRSLLPPQLKQMSARYKIMYGCECCISAKSIYSSFLSWRDKYLKNSRIKAKMLKVEGMVRKHITYIQHIKIQ